MEFSKLSYLEILDIARNPSCCGCMHARVIINEMNKFLGMDNYYDKYEIDSNQFYQEEIHNDSLSF